MVHWSAPNSLIMSYLQPCTNSMWGDESEVVAPIIWLYQTVDARKEEVFFPDLLITLRRHDMSYFNGLMQERCNSIANALELRLSCTNPWMVLPWSALFGCFGAWVVIRLYGIRCPEPFQVKPVKNSRNVGSNIRQHIHETFSNIFFSFQVYWQCDRVQETCLRITFSD